MSDFLLWLQKHMRAVILTIACFLLFVVFESFQQLFYLENFNNGVVSDLSFWGVLQGGIYRWMIWLGVAIPLVLLVQRFPVRGLSKKDLLAHAGLITGALFINLSIITSLNATVRSSFWTNFPEVFEFFFFHKAPIILVALIFLVLLVYYFRNQEVLEVTIREVGQLKRANEGLFEELEKGQLDDESLVIEVKTGNRVKLLSENSIRWIEADDYCVRIHDNEGMTHILRSSLKAFEQKLPSNKFLRVHRKAIVNLECVKEYKLGSAPVVRLTDGVELPIAQSRLRELKNSLQPI